MEFDKWIEWGERGERLGLKGETLLAFVKEQQAAAKEEKGRELEERQAVHEEHAHKEEMEREERARKEETEREECKEEVECGVHAREAERMKKEMQMNIELAKIQWEIEAATRAYTALDTGDV